ncbi:MAG: histidine phosphatase family protein [Chloroflexota bacterium]
MRDERLILVRHGITDWNREGRFQGHLDPPLGDDGRREAAMVAARLMGDPQLRPARVISSSLSRALETAAPIAERAGVSVEPEPRLMEIGQGAWEGRLYAELAVSDARRYEAWRRSSGVRRPPPGGESTRSALARVGSVLTELTSGPGAWPVCVVSHGGTLRVLARLLFDLKPTTSWALDVDNASISVALRFGRRWRLERWNDTLHLLGREQTHVDEAEGRPLAL